MPAGFAGRATTPYPYYVTIYFRLGVRTQRRHATHTTRSPINITGGRCGFDGCMSRIVPPVFCCVATCLLPVLPGKRISPVDPFGRSLGHLSQPVNSVGGEQRQAHTWFYVGSAVAISWTGRLDTQFHHFSSPIVNSPTHYHSRRAHLRRSCMTATQRVRRRHARARLRNTYTATRI